MSAEATGWVWKHSPFKGSELLVHLAIADVVNDAHGNEFWMSAGKLAEKAKVSRSTAVTALSDMVRLGLLEVLEPGAASRRPTVYRFACPDVGLARSDWPSEHARTLVTDTNEPNERTQSEASADVGLAALADPNCFICHGDGRGYHAGSGRVTRCDCTRHPPLTVIEGGNAY